MANPNAQIRPGREMKWLVLLLFLAVAWLYYLMLFQKDPTLSKASSSKLKTIAADLALIDIELKNAEARFADLMKSGPVREFMEVQQAIDADGNKPYKTVTLTPINIKSAEFEKIMLQIRLTKEALATARERVQEAQSAAADR